jgi:hypothetical protein
MSRREDAKVASETEVGENGRIGHRGTETQRSDANRVRSIQIGEKESHGGIGSIYGSLLKVPDLGLDPTSVSLCLCGQSSEFCVFDL